MLKIDMKKITIIILSVFLFSCENEPVDFNLINENNNNNSIVLDTLKNYSDYILGDFNGKFLVSTNVHVKSYSAVINSNPISSSYIQFQLGYKLIDNDVEKSVWVTYRFLESNTKLDINNYYRYKYYSDFVSFFNRNQFDYFQSSQPINNVHNVHNVHIEYKNFYDVNTHTDMYGTSDYNKEMRTDDFIFSVDSIRPINNPIKKVEVYYSFKCIGVNSYRDEFKIKNGKGKSTFIYND